MHGGRMAQHVRSNMLADKRWTFPPRDVHIFGDEALDGIVAQATAAAAGEEEVGRACVGRRDPSANRTCGVAVERRAPFLAALAMTPDVRCSAEHAMVDTETGQLGNA